ncbi:MAG: putative transporter [Marinilabiliaceae bacterium]|nr:putative transporter [Bacteroidales bacterium]MCR5696108.1 putative transporter [Marinilabiliaceae bacterium]
MDFLVELFCGDGLATALIYISLTAFLGILLGKVSIFKVRLGVAGVLFVGIILAHFGARVNGSMLHFAQEFGLILFVYAIGINVGPRFFASLRNDGLQLNAFAVSIVLLGFGIAFALHKVLGIPPAVITGIMCGAVTNTPGLGAARQVVTDFNATHPAEAVDANMLGTGYAVAYPLGVLGIIMTMILIRSVFRIKVSHEVDKYNESIATGNQVESVVVKITNANLFGKTIEFITDYVDKELVFSRIERNGEFLVPTATFILEEGDIVHGVSDDKNVDNLRIKLGDVEIGQKRDVDGDLVMRRFLITNKKVAGKTLEQLGIYRRYPANITRIYRAGTQVLPNKRTTLEIGDAVRVVGRKDVMDEIKAELGDSITEWSHPNIVPMFMGIALGLIVGAIPFFIPGLPAPAKLGLAGGPLLIALLLGWKGRIGSMNFYMNSGANMVLREMGITLFLACVGLGAGGNFVKTILEGGYMWVLYGFIITVVPLIIVGSIARLMKVNYLKICGFMAGAMTDPPALEYSNSLSSTHAQSMAYATVYPLTMFLRILFGQTLILITL